MRKHKVLFALAFAAVLATGTTALAGYKAVWPVFINLSSRYAQGSLGSARNSADSNQFIGCTLQPGFVYCGAVDANRNSLNCTSSTPSFVALVQSLGDEGALAFTADASGNCTSIIVYTYSYWEPKQP
jgi:hypothetical protein